MRIAGSKNVYHDYSKPTPGAFRVRSRDTAIKSVMEVNTKTRLMTRLTIEEFGRRNKFSDLEIIELCEALEVTDSEFPPKIIERIISEYRS